MARSKSSATTCSTLKEPGCMVEPISPLGDAYRPGSFGNLADGTSVAISLTAPGSIVEVASWRGNEQPLIDAIRDATGLSIPVMPGAGAVKDGMSGFGIGPGRFLLVDE